MAIAGWVGKKSMRLVLLGTSSRFNVLAGGAGRLSSAFGTKTMENEIAEVVRERGWFSAHVYDADPPFIYTIGLMQTWDHPESDPLRSATEGGPRYSVSYDRVNQDQWILP